MVPENYEEDHGEISLRLVKIARLPGSRRWDGSASAFWGSITRDTPLLYRFRSKRSARKFLLGKMQESRRNLGELNIRALSEAISGLRDFGGRDLSAIVLRGMNLRRVNFFNTSLQEADLSGTDLRESDLSFAYVSGADFSRSNLSGSNITATAFWGSDLTEVDFQNVSHTGDVHSPPSDPMIPMECWAGWLYFVDCYMSDSNFDGAKLQGVFFKRCDLSRTTFRRANLEDARFLDCKLEETVFDDALLSGAHIGKERSDDRRDNYFPPGFNSLFFDESLRFE